MIKFFRHIRKKLADDNKPMKYLRYAIGEIVLVMLGILLALQVNNWNENRKVQKNEIKLVEQLLEDAKADSVFFESRVLFQKIRDTLFNDIINVSKNISVDSISKRRVNDNPFFFRLAYQSNLINNNPEAYDLVNHDAIKNKLRDYKVKYDYVVHSIELSNRITEQYGIPLQIKYHDETQRLGDNPAVQDLSYIIADKKAVATLEQFRIYGVNFLIQLQQFLIVNQELILMIEAYLEI